MAKYPVNESEIVSLAQEVVSGFQAHDVMYPTPPLTPEALETLIQNYNDKKYAALNAQSVAAQAVKSRTEALQALNDGLKSELRYAEIAVKNDNDKLKLIGWGGKAAPTPLEKPSQPSNLESPRRTLTSIDLTWSLPDKSPKVAAYCVQRRERPSGAWQTVAMAVDTAITLTDQPRGIEFEYRVIAANKAGESNPSSILEAIF